MAVTGAKGLSAGAGELHAEQQKVRHTAGATGTVAKCKQLGVCVFAVMSGAKKQFVGACSSCLKRGRGECTGACVCPCIHKWK